MNHFNKKGNPYIVDVSMKNITERSASASGEVKFDKETFKKIQSFKTKKGNIEKTAIIAGIMGAKETSRLIPLCHNIPINHINIEIKKHLSIIKVEEPAKRKSGIMLKTVDELVDKLKNEAKVI